MEISTLQITEGMREILKSTIGKILTGFSIYKLGNPSKNASSTHCVTFQNAWLNIDGEVFNIHNEYTDKPCAYFNPPEAEFIEDTPCFGVFKRTFEETPYMNQGTFPLDTVSVGEKITDIQIATDTYIDDNPDGTQTKLITDVAIVFLLEKKKIVFERSVWFSENIEITVMPIENPVELLSNKDGDEQIVTDDETDEVLSESEFSREFNSVMK